jgi:DNA-binding transcriptional LysR family regulator
MRDLNNLVSFLAVAEHGSINRAAMALNVSQPALTRTIHLFEGTLGLPLFVRSAKGVRLTSFGERLAEHARIIRAEAKNIDATVHQAKTAERRSVHIAVVPQQPLPIFARALIDIVEEEPQIHCCVNVRGRNEAMELLKLGEADMVLGPLLVKGENSLAIQDALFYDDNGIYCSASHPFAGRKHVPLSELLKEKWVLGPRGSESTLRIDDVFLSHGLHVPPIHLEVDEVSARRVIVGQSNYLSGFHSHHLLSTGTSEVAQIRCNWPQEGRRMGAIRLTPHTGFSAKFIKAMRSRLIEAGLRIPPEAEAQEADIRQIKAMPPRVNPGASPSSKAAVAGRERPLRSLKKKAASRVR